MGASGWAYLVPYQPDIQQALDELRQLVFAHGGFAKGEAWWRDLDFADFLPPEDLDEAELAEYRAEFDRLQALPEPTTIQEWLDWNGEQGTHSILDVDRVVATVPPIPELAERWDDPQAMYAIVGERLGTVSPPTDAELMAILGTTRPTREQIHAGAGALQALRDRGAGVYVVVYEADRPAEIFFGGVSGD